MDEIQYLQLLQKVLTDGDDRKDRTGTGTKAIFGETLKFDLSSFPLLTTKKVSLKNIFEELMWMLRGQTNSKILEEKGITIWKGNSSKEFLTKRGLPYEEGVIGPGYGYQWRSWGGDYPERNGIDQIANVLKSLKEDPFSRRHLVSAWNVSQLDQISLPPCHIMFEFFISDKGLSCLIFLRSNDLFLGAPYNIASYALLTSIFARYLKVKPLSLTYVIGDAHIYTDHFDQVKIQTTRVPRNFPKLNITKELNTFEDILALEFTDLELIGYDPHLMIKGKMSV